MKAHDRIIIKGSSLCYKPYLKPEEAMIYCNLQRTQVEKRVNEFDIYKNNSDYYFRIDLDKMISGISSLIEEKNKKIKLDLNKSK